MDAPVRDRPLTPVELTRLRLILSTFRDGSGQRVKAGFMPNFLSFERSCARVIGGSTNENKGVFDVEVPGDGQSKPWGVSCKMAVTQPVKNGCWFMELSNSAKYLHDALGRAGIQDWRADAQSVGPVLVNTVVSWHEQAREKYDVDSSKYLLLTHDAKWRRFRVACFRLDILTRTPPNEVIWETSGSRENISSVVGYVEFDNSRHRLWSWYANSGGQLKFYPPLGWEEWSSDEFELLSPPIKDLKDRVDEYWPSEWPCD